MARKSSKRRLDKSFSQRARDTQTKRLLTIRSPIKPVVTMSVDIPVQRTRPLPVVSPIRRVIQKGRRIKETTLSPASSAFSYLKEKL